MHRKAAPLLIALSLAAPVLAARALAPLAPEPAGERHPGHATPEDPLPPDPDAAVTAEELHHHVAFLASDELRGRQTGTPEIARAARYLADVLASFGVEPAGDDGSFLQAVPLVRPTHAGPPALEVTLVGEEVVALEGGIGFDVSVRGEPRSTALLPLVVVASVEELPVDPDPARALFLAGRTTDVRDWLATRPEDWLQGWGLVVETGRTTEGTEPRTPGGGRLVRRQEPDPADVVRLRGDLNGLLEAGEIAALELTYDATLERVDDANVVGRLQGVGTPEEPGLADEVIVLSAHYDHIGTMGDPETAEEDVIFNGADDDATGTAAVLEIAQALAAGEPPARTVVFLLATGEEMGLLGTHHYIEHPAEPLERTVCNLNLEMLGRPDELAGGSGRLWLTGYERSTLGQAFQESELPLVPDPRLDQNFFQRSDNFAFAVRGIVAQTLSSYNLHEDYHRVSDEVDGIDFAHLETAVEGCLAGTRLLVSGALDPEWLPGGNPAE